MKCDDEDVSGSQNVAGSEEVLTTRAAESVETRKTVEQGESLYVTMDDKGKGLKVLQVNCRSILNKVSEFKS